MFIGVDIGGTSIKGGQLINNSNIQKTQRIAVDRKENETQFLEKVTQVIEPLLDNKVLAIGIGIPGIVDNVEGIIYNIQNIPLLKKVFLKAYLEAKYKLPVFINNDANCFAIGENHFGLGANYSNFLGVTIGTGLGVGIIINNALYSGKLCGAGEIGMLPYKDGTIEDYTGSLFFKQKYNTTGEALFKKALQGDSEALIIFNEFGKHLGNAINTMLYTYAPQTIILGGAISKAYSYFKDGVEEKIKTFEFREQLRNFEIHISQHPDMGIIGAAALCLDEKLE
ncbi:ROK family protein [Flavobacteriaceae bacterium R38]|nr:ROK family protein [Flavobacteriaceae bacterium R38]